MQTDIDIGHGIHEHTICLNECGRVCVFVCVSAMAEFAF